MNLTDFIDVTDRPISDSWRLYSPRHQAPFARGLACVLPRKLYPGENEQADAHVWAFAEGAAHEDWRRWRRNGQHIGWPRG